MSPFTEFSAVARTYPVACSGVRQRNFDFTFRLYKIIFFGKLLQPNFGEHLMEIGLKCSGFFVN